MSDPGALERCVGDVARFADEHWGRRPLLHRAPDGARGFAELLDLPDVDRLVTETLLRLPSFRLVKDGTPLDPKTYTQTLRIGGDRLPGTIRPEKVAQAFAGGATIVLQALHRLWPPVASFCRELELALTHPVQANAYVTPATARGFAVHHDTHDVFVLQTHGHKAWRVYPPVVELAGREQPWRKDLGEPGEPMLEAELGPGDCLYVPRGFLHDAEAREEVSIHVTVGIQAQTWLDLWRSVLGEAPDHRPFRDALPIGYASDPSSVVAELPARTEELVDWLRGTAGEEAVRSFARSFFATRRPILPGQLVQAERLRIRGLTLGTEVRRRPGAVFEVSSADGEAVALLGNRELRMPPWCEPALRFVAEATGRFTVGDLPGLDDASREVLALRLAREGALEVLDAG
jgi:bifunctional lysine-specific demethylase and histidyl-hydroxylase NO66